MLWRATDQDATARVGAGQAGAGFVSGAGGRRTQPQASHFASGSRARNALPFPKSLVRLTWPSKAWVRCLTIAQRDIPDIERLAARLDLRQVQQILDQLVQPVRLLFDPRHEQLVVLRPPRYRCSASTWASIDSSVTATRRYAAGVPPSSSRSAKYDIRRCSVGLERTTLPMPRSAAYWISAR